MRRVINFRNVFVRAGFLPPTVARWVRVRLVVLGEETVACPDQGKDRFTHHVDALRVVDLARQFDVAVEGNDTAAFLSARRPGAGPSCATRCKSRGYRTFR